MQKKQNSSSEPIGGLWKYLIFMAWTLCFVDAGQLRCDRAPCYYYLRLTQQYSQQLRSAGYRLFQQCNCRQYGLYLYSQPQTQRPVYRPPTQAPVYRPPTQAPYVPPQQSRCGVSSVTGSASTYLSSQGGRVVGGQNVQECEFPWAVYVEASGSTCGGSIVDSRHIVTAAHCMRTNSGVRPAYTVQVKVGSSYRNNLQAYRVSRVTVHPSYYAASFNNDVAVLTLSSSLPTNNRCIQPICLPSNLQLRTGTRCIVAGWGLTAEYSGYSPNVMQKAVVPIVSMSQCSQAYGSTINDLKICAGYLNGGIDACKGDSGGPLMCAEGNSWVLAGIVSFGNGCAKPNYPGVYAYVPNLKSWIQSITQSY